MAATIGGVAGGAAQSYLTMGMTTCMKTVEVTRNKEMAKGARVPGTMETFFDILRTQGIRGVNKGVNAVALRQITGWSSRMGISKAAEGPIRRLRGKGKTDTLTMGEKIAASTVGGALSCWNQPFEVKISGDRYYHPEADEETPTGHQSRYASSQERFARRNTYHGVDGETNMADKWPPRILSGRRTEDRGCVVGNNLYGRAW